MGPHRYIGSIRATVGAEIRPQTRGQRSYNKEHQVKKILGIVAVLLFAVAPLLVAEEAAPPKKKTTTATASAPTKPAPKAAAKVHAE